MSEFNVKTEYISERIKGLFDKPLSEIMVVVETLSDIIELEELETVKEDLNNLNLDLLKLNSKFNRQSIQKKKISKSPSKVLKNRILDLIQNNRMNHSFLTTNKLIEETGEDYQRVKYCINQLIKENKICCDMSGFQHKFYARG